MPAADDDLTTTASYRLVGRGSDLGIDVTGATAEVARRGSAPKAATWHGARLEPDGDHWTGHVTIDL